MEKGKAGRLDNVQLNMAQLGGGEQEGVDPERWNQLTQSNIRQGEEWASVP